MRCVIVLTITNCLFRKGWVILVCYYFVLATTECPYLLMGVFVFEALADWHATVIWLAKGLCAQGVSVTGLHFWFFFFKFSSLFLCLSLSLCLSQLTKAHRQGHMVKVDWLDRLTFREIEMINEVSGFGVNGFMIWHHYHFCNLFVEPKLKTTSLSN